MWKFLEVTNVKQHFKGQRMLRQARRQLVYKSETEAPVIKTVVHPNFSRTYNLSWGLYSLMSLKFGFWKKQFSDEFPFVLHRPFYWSPGYHDYFKTKNFKRRLLEAVSAYWKILTTQGSMI